MLLFAALGLGGAPGDRIPVSDAVAFALLAGLELVALVAVVGIWRESGRPLAARLLWTAVTLVPVLGLLAYAAWRDPPPPSDPVDRPPERGD